MTFNGNHIFHYTSFECAIKILLSGFLRFGTFENMNDIAEVKRDYLANISDEEINKIFSLYRSISLTKDCGQNDRGFAIDTLWGYYAEKGNGACLVFDKDRLFREYWKSFAPPGVPDDLEVVYLERFTNAITFGGDNKTQIESEIDNRIQDIFYTKASCWAHEKEIRLITKKQKELPINDSVIGIILCFPKVEKIEDTNQYRILEQIAKLQPIKIYHYRTILGERTLSDIDGIKWPILGVDYQLDTE